MGRTPTGTPARTPDREGAVERDGVRVHWESYGRGEPAILLLPAWSIVHSRLWKAQIAYLARRFQVVTFDGRGNGLSDRPADPAAYADAEFVADALAVMDAAAAGAVVAVGVSAGGTYALELAAAHPARVRGVVAIAPSAPYLSPPPPERAVYSFEDELATDEGWAKDNRHYWLRDYRGYLEFFFSEMFPEPHSTKQIEDCVAFGLDTSAETLLDTRLRMGWQGGAAGAEALCRSLSCPVLVVVGDEDRIIAPARSERVAELTGGGLVTIVHGGHGVQARHPVKVNLLLRDFAERVAPPPPRRERWPRALARPRRALFVSSPIGLGHAWRDVAIADELRRLVPGLEIQWLAQPPVTTVLEARGEHVHEASAELASESDHVDAEAGEHELNAFEMLRRMDEILVANFMVFHDASAAEAFDLWIGDEAWELDHFLHENPELKRAPFAWLTDFVGFVPMPEHGAREAELTADMNAELIDHVERFPFVRDRAVYVGDPADLVDLPFGPGLPSIPAWTAAHHEFSGYIRGFDPGSLPPRDALRAELGWGADEPVCVAAVGGSGAGASLLRRAVDALPALRERVPGLRLVAVTGPRIEPSALPEREGLEVRGYVHELHRLLAACDVAVVQGGLTTTMELVALGKPFVSVPLDGHFEQQVHVRHRLDRYGARTHLAYADATPDRLADAVAAQLASRPRYGAVAPGGAARAAASIASLLGR